MNWEAAFKKWFKNYPFNIYNYPTQEAYEGALQDTKNAFKAGWEAKGHG